LEPWSDRWLTGFMAVLGDEPQKHKMNFVEMLFSPVQMR